MEQNAILNALSQVSSVRVRQKRELAELIGFESRNKYAVTTETGQEIAFCAEQGKGFLATLARYFVGHWRSFELHLFDGQRQPQYVAHNPFRFYFSRLELRNTRGELIGALQRRFGILSKNFDMEDDQGQVLMSVSSPLWRPWTFEFEKNGQPVARIEKKWSGFLKEAFTDADNLGVTFSSLSLGPRERLLLVASAIFVDLLYFERKAQ